MWKKFLGKDKEAHKPSEEEERPAPHPAEVAESAIAPQTPVSSTDLAPQVPKEVPRREEPADAADAEESDGLIVSIRETGPCRREISVEVLPERVESEREEVVGIIRGKARIPGFRPGKAPLHMVKARYAEQILEETKERVAATTLDEELDARGLVPLQRPRITKFEYEEGGSLTYVADVEIAPQIPEISLDALKGKRPRVEVLDPEIEEELNRLRESHAEVAPVDRPSQKGDVLRIAYRPPASRKEESKSVLVGPSGEPIGSGAAQEEETEPIEMPVELGAGGLLPELDDGLVGVLAGGERAITVTYPEDYGNKELAGREVTLHVTVREVNEKRLPALDDEFAAKVMEGATLTSLREKIGEMIKHSKDREAERRFNESLFDAVLERVPFEVPESFVVSMERQLHADLERRVGPDSPQLRDARLRQMYRAVAEREVRRMFVTRELARRHAVRVTREEVEARLDAMTDEVARIEGMDAARARKAVRSDGSAERTAERLLEEKVVQLLREKAEVEEGSPV